MVGDLIEAIGVATRSGAVNAARCGGIAEGGPARPDAGVNAARCGGIAGVGRPGPTPA
ncbi:MAG: hypothetical protein ACLP50_20970 [Solirubrobacteraceae bacterium]